MGELSLVFKRLVNCVRLGPIFSAKSSRGLDVSTPSIDHSCMCAFAIASLLSLTLTGEAPRIDAPPARETFTYKTASDCAIQADVYRPHQDGDDQSHPVIFWIHGGALIGGHRGN